MLVVEKSFHTTVPACLIKLNLYKVGWVYDYVQLETQVRVAPLIFTTRIMQL